MNPVALLLAIVESVIGVGSFAYLFINVTGTCSGVINLLCCVLFMVFSVLAAASWKKALTHKALN